MIRGVDDPRIIDVLRHFRDNFELQVCCSCSGFNRLHCDEPSLLVDKKEDRTI